VRRAAAILPVTLVLASSGCQPTFEPKGSLTVRGAPFAPVSCEVLASCDSGIALRDVQGNQLSLKLPPQTLRAWERIEGTPRAELTMSGRPPIDLGPCGQLALSGEGYHGDGKRAASGTMSLECSSRDAQVRGTLRFSGCF
jgi:hypothetical protein